jgi:inosose dehydratase
MTASLLTRRQFVLSCGAGAVASTVLAKSLAGSSLFLPASTIQFGYASITWNGNDAQAIKDISELGFRGIQLRSNILPEYGTKAEALRALLAQNKLEMVALSSGGVGIASNTEGRRNCQARQQRKVC